MVSAHHVNVQPDMGIGPPWDVSCPKDGCEVATLCVESQPRRSQEAGNVPYRWGPPLCPCRQSLQLCQWNHCIILPMEECSNS